jgi:hypothetical protein
MKFDEKGFRSHLRTLAITLDDVRMSVLMAHRFCEWMRDGGRAPTAESAWEFSRVLIAERANTPANYLALARYCRYLRNDELFIAFFELIDGQEVAQNLYEKVEQQFGAGFRLTLYTGNPVAPIGTPTPEKPSHLLPIIGRMRVRLGSRTTAELLSHCLRDLPDDNYLHERRRYFEINDIDLFLRDRKSRFLARLEECRRDSRLFFAQHITDWVLDYVRMDPEIGGGQRQGNIVYETKIPYDTPRFLEATDPLMKRYYACHCPWAREAIREGSPALQPLLCNCSVGFHRKPWEIIFGCDVEAEVLESALLGDMRCRFAIHLPSHALMPSADKE